MPSTELTAITDLIPSVLLDCPDLDEGLAKEYLQEMARDFFIRSRALTEQVEITTVADQAAYDLTPATAQMIVTRILRAQIEDSTSLLDPRTYSLAPDTRKFTFSDRWIPTTGGDTVLVLLVLRPERRATTYPAWALGEFETAILAGTLWKLHRLPGNPWTDPNLAEQCRREYLAAISRAIGDLATGGTSRDEQFGA